MIIVMKQAASEEDVDKVKVDKSKAVKAKHTLTLMAATHLNQGPAIDAFSADRLMID